MTPRSVMIGLAFLVFVGIFGGAPAAVAAQSRKPVVLVLDVGRVRLRGERLQGVLSTRLERDVVRVTDERAHDAAGTLTIAHDAGRHWLLQYQSRGRVETAEARVAQAGALMVVLAELAANLVDRLETGGNESGRSTTTNRDQFYTIWADEILDPYAGLPVRAVVAPVVVADLLDPFTVTTAGRVRFTEVLDPWALR